MSAPAVQKCWQTACDQDGTVRVYWPGFNPARLMCDSHSAQAQAVAHAMGFDLVVEAIQRAGGDQ